MIASIRALSFLARSKSSASAAAAFVVCAVWVFTRLGHVVAADRSCVNDYLLRLESRENVTVIDVTVRVTGCLRRPRDRREFELREEFLRLQVR